MIISFVPHCDIYKNYTVLDEIQAEAIFDHVETSNINKLPIWILDTV